EYRGDEKVTTDLHQIGRGGLLAEPKCALAHCFEQLRTGVNRVGRAGHSKKELSGSGGFGASEDRSGNESLAAIVMCHGQLLGERDTDRAAGNVNGAPRQCLRYSVIGEHDRFESTVIRKHCDYSLAAASGGDVCR